MTQKLFRQKPISEKHSNNAAEIEAMFWGLSAIKTILESNDTISSNQKSDIKNCILLGCGKNGSLIDYDFKVIRNRLSCLLSLGAAM